MEAGVEDLLGGETGCGPERVGFSSENEAGELTEHGGFLGFGSVVGRFIEGLGVGVFVVGELASGRDELGFTDECVWRGVGEGEDEVGEGECAVGAGEDGPLSVGGFKGAMEGCEEACFKKQFSGEREWDTGLGVSVEDFSAQLGGAGFACEVEGEADVVPSEVSEAAERFCIGLGADIVCEKVRCGGEAELREQGFWGADGFAEVAGEVADALAVHEHDSVHELQVSGGAGVDDFFGSGGGGGDGFFEEEVFAVGGGFEGPVLTRDGWEREIDGVDVGAAEEFVVAAEGLGGGFVRGGGLAFCDEGLSTLELAACDGDEARVACVAECLPVFSSDLGGAEDAPADGVAAHFWIGFPAACQALKPWLR